MSGANIDRRAFLELSLLAGGATALAGAPAAAAPPPAAVAPARASMKINGERLSLEFDARTSLLDLLRERLGLTGTKKGCNQGACGACTVLVDGRRVNACLTLAALCHETSVTTIEGLSRGKKLHPLQRAFIKHDAFQCGYCTPGQIMSGVGCIAEGGARSAESVKESMSGNICRCGAYPNIAAAILEVGGRRPR